jgi:hypothetical protein
MGTPPDNYTCYLCKKEISGEWPSREVFVYIALRIGKTRYSHLGFCFDCFEASAGWDFVVPLVEPMIERFGKEKAMKRSDYDSLLALEKRLDEYYRSKRKM